MAGTFGDKDVESRVTHLLQGDKADRNQAIELIHQHFRHALCGAARRRNSRIDLEDLWGHTLAWFCSHSQSADYDASVSPIPLLHRFIVRRAIERRRRDAKQDLILRELANRLRGTRTGEWWQNCLPLERQEVLSDIEKIVAGLPRRQRQVCQIYVYHFPKTVSMAKLRELVEKEQGAYVSRASVERALQEGRKKIRAIFADKNLS